MQRKQKESVVGIEPRSEKTFWDKTYATSPKENRLGVELAIEEGVICPGEPPNRCTCAQSALAFIKSKIVGEYEINSIVVQYSPCLCEGTGHDNVVGVEPINYIARCGIECPQYTIQLPPVRAFDNHLNKRPKPCTDFQCVIDASPISDYDLAVGIELVLNRSQRGTNKLSRLISRHDHRNLGGE